MSPLQKPVAHPDRQPNNIPNQQPGTPNQQPHSGLPPAPPPQAHFCPPQSVQISQPNPQAGMAYAQLNPQQHPQQQQRKTDEPWVFLGFNNTMYTQKAMYGPPGSQFDYIGNVFFAHEGGSKEYVLPYRGYNGKYRTPPQPEDDCCGFWHWIGYRTDYHWQSTEYQQSPFYQQAIAASR